MTIIVYDKPDVVVTQFNTMRAKIYGRNGYVLRVILIDILNRKEIGNVTFNIDSDEYDISIALLPNDFSTLPPSYKPGHVLVRLQVEDNNGNIYEIVDTVFPYDESSTNLVFSEEVEAWIVSKLGYSWSRRGTSINIPSSKLYYTIIYRKNYLAMYEGNEKVQEVHGRSAVITLDFIVDRTIAQVLGNNIDDKDIARLIASKKELVSIVDVIGALKLAENVFTIRRFTPLGYGVKFDDNYVYVTVVTQVDLETPIDIWGIIKVVVGVLSIIGGALLLVLSAGLSAPASYVLIASGVGAVISGVLVFTSTMREAPRDIIERAEEIATQTIQDMENTAKDLESYLDSLVSQGKITAEEKQKIMNYVNQIIERAKKGLTELKDLVQKAYEEGYNEGYEKGKEEMKKWAIASGVGGSILGGIIGYSIGKGRG